MRKTFLKSFLVAGLLTSIAAPAMADEFAKAIKDGNAYIQNRYRYEHVDQDGFSKDAKSSTLRTKFGYETGTYKNFKALIEAEGVFHLGDDKFNDTVNGKTSYPVVADVDGVELNQAYIAYTGIKDATLKFGRQRIGLGNQRFVGHVGWRQNDQTFDMVSAEFKPTKNLNVYYGFADQANRIFGEDSKAGEWEMDSHFINVSYQISEGLDVTAYGYLLDIEDAAAVSSETYGVNIKGKKEISKTKSFSYDLEYARQSDYGDNTKSYDADYYRIAPTLTMNGVTLGLGYEVLGSDNGNAAFSTPLATLHKFNGFADKFLTTPVNGLEDMYVSASYKMPYGIVAKAIYHDFSANEGSADYGTEVDVVLKKKITDNYTALIKFADYNADTYSTDTQKVSVNFMANF